MLTKEQVFFSKKKRTIKLKILLKHSVQNRSKKVKHSQKISYQILTLFHQIFVKLLLRKRRPLLGKLI